MLSSRRLLIGITLVAAASLGQDQPAQPQPLTPEQAADLVLAGKKPPADIDGWAIADELCARGKRAAALTFARSLEDKDYEKLAAYVEARGEDPSPVQQWRALMKTGKFADAATLSERIGWHRGTSRSLGELTIGYLKARDPRKALAVAQRNKALQERRGVRGDLGKTIAHLALCYQGLREFDRAVEYGKQALAIARETKDAKFEGNTQNNLGRTYLMAGKTGASLASFEAAVAIRKKLGDGAGEASSLMRVSFLHQQRGNMKGSELAARRALKLFEELGDERRTAWALHFVGVALGYRHQTKKALACHERAAAIYERLGDRVRLQMQILHIGKSHGSLGDKKKWISYLERSLAMAERLRAPLAVAEVLCHLGWARFSLGEPPARALAALNRSLAIYEKHRPTAAWNALEPLANVHGTLGNHEQGRRLLEKARDMHKRAGRIAPAAIATEKLGNLCMQMNDFDAARRHMREALQALRSVGLDTGVASMLGQLAAVEARAGDAEAALALYAEANEARKRVGPAALTLQNAAYAHVQLGQYAKALASMERALAIRRAEPFPIHLAEALSGYGLLHTLIGNRAEARRYLTEALAFFEKQDMRPKIARTVERLAAVSESKEAYEHYLRAAALYEQLGDRLNQSIALMNAGMCLRALGRVDEGIALIERALAIKRELGHVGVYQDLLRLGICRVVEEPDRALALFEEALRGAREQGDVPEEVECLRSIAEVHLRKERPSDAVRLLREAIGRLALLSTGLGQEEGASLRDARRDVFELGQRAARMSEDTGEMVFFLESGMAGALLESLGGRDALAAASLPAELKKAERKARETLIAARGRYAAAKKRKELRSARKSIAAAERAVLAVATRIQREAKAVADVSFPTAASVDEIRGWVRDGEAMVLYGDGVAAVVERSGARIVALPESPSIKPLLEALASNGTFDLARLHAALVAPLGLKAKRVLVAPRGVLAYVPFALLMPEREVVYIPSGTTYGLLRDGAKERGKGVLALGDPDYAGTRLTALPGTRKEVEAIGDTKLLARDATKAKLGEHLGRRLRAVHFACHGVLDAERPMLSSLALSGGERLRVLEVFRMNVPADLVVLSACETGRGKVYRAEGVVGFTRAFMLAGSPRVIVSLWKVDDDATRALMVKFYELWGEHPTATALKRAQAFVRGHEKWKHPYYWAAWQLWGLGD